jgi:hypothetical protein
MLEKTFWLSLCIICIYTIIINNIYKYYVLKTTPEIIKYVQKQGIFDDFTPKNSRHATPKTQQFHTMATFFYTIGVESK